MENQEVRNLGEVLRDEMVMKDKIIALLHEEPKTVPEIAEAIEQPAHETMLWVMALWRYGKIIETGKANADGYFQYKIKE